MRDIKFRAWVESVGKFMYWGIGDINGDGAYFSGPPNDAKAIHQQFTGLKDNNGKDIYEGDILSFMHGEQQKKEREKVIGVVKSGTAEFVLLYGYSSKSLSKMDGNNKICWREEYHRCSTPYGYFEFSLFKVIGNIYENPELLTEQAENAREAAQESAGLDSLGKGAGQ